MSECWVGLGIRWLLLLSGWFMSSSRKVSVIMVIEVWGMVVSSWDVLLLVLVSCGVVMKVGVVTIIALVSTLFIC